MISLDMPFWTVKDRRIALALALRLREPNRDRKEFSSRQLNDCVEINR